MPSFLSRLSGLVPSFAGIRAAPAPAQTRRERPDISVEKVPHILFGSRQWILPYGDSTSTDDDPTIRTAMRKMLRDPYVKTAWLSQLLTVLAQEFQVHHPDARKNQLAQDAVDLCRYAIENADGGLLGIGNAIAMNLGSDGFSLAEKVWTIVNRGKHADRLTLKALKPKDPEDLNLVADEYRNVTAVRVMRTGETWPISDFTYTRYLHTFDEPMGMAAFRAGYASYWMRDTVRKLRVIHHEKHAGGVWMGTYQDPSDKSTLEAALARVRQAMWAAVPEGVKMEVVARTTASEADWKSFDESLREETLVSIALAHLHILQGGVSDARGNTKVHKEVSDLGPWLLTYIIQEVINRQIFPDLCDYNFVGLDEYPRITLGGVTNEEILQQFQILDAAQRAGFKPSRSHYAQVLTIQESDPQDPGDQLAPPPPPGMGGGGDPFGGMGDGLPPSDPFGGGGGGLGGGDPFAGAGGDGASLATFSEDWAAPVWESFAWTAEKTRRGTVKAVGTGEHAGRVVYGKRAQALLARSSSSKSDQPAKGRKPKAPAPDRSTFERAASGDVTAREAVEDHLADEVESAADQMSQVPQLPPGGVRAVTDGLTADLFAVQTPRGAARTAVSFLGRLLSDAGNAASHVARFTGWLLRAGASVAVPVVKALARASWWLTKRAGGAVLSYVGEGAKAILGPTVRTVARWTPFVVTHLATVAAGAAALTGIALGVPYLPAPFLVKLGVGVAGISSAAMTTRYLAPKILRRVAGPAFDKAAREQGIITGDVKDLRREFSEDDDIRPNSPAHRRAHFCFAEPLDGPDEFALAGSAGQRVGQLLRSAERHGRETFHRLTESAVRRLLSDPDPLTAPVLFNDEELAELRDSLASSTTAADLLGRARVRRMADFASRQVTSFAESDPFDAFDDELEIAKPEAAVEWFRSRVPILNVQASRYAPRVYRHAGMIASAADEALLNRVKAAILQRLETGRGGANVVQDILDAAGVTPKNPSYSDLVVRTNLTTAYAEGQDAEMSTPDMQELFPAWEYHAIVDGRERPHHGARDGRLYPSSVRFVDVRGHDVSDAANCRCGHSPVSKFMLQGRRVETSW